MVLSHAFGLPLANELISGVRLTDSANDEGQDVFEIEPVYRHARRRLPAPKISKREMCRVLEEHPSAPADPAARRAGVAALKKRLRWCKSPNAGVATIWRAMLTKVSRVADWTTFAERGWGWALTVRAGQDTEVGLARCSPARTRIRAGREASRYYRLGCRRQYCPFCAPTVVREEVGKVWPELVAWTEAGYVPFKIVLTVPPEEGWTAIELLERQARRIGDFVREFLSQPTSWGEGATYLAKWEFQRGEGYTGNPHCNILLLLPINVVRGFQECVQDHRAQPGLASCAQRHGFGVQCHVGSCLYPDDLKAYKAGDQAAIYRSMAKQLRDTIKSSQTIGHAWRTGFHLLSRARGGGDGLIRPWSDWRTLQGRQLTEREDRWHRHAWTGQLEALDKGGGLDKRLLDGSSEQPQVEDGERPPPVDSPEDLARPNEWGRPGPVKRDTREKMQDWTRRLAANCGQRIEGARLVSGNRSWRDVPYEDEPPQFVYDLDATPTQVMMALRTQFPHATHAIKFDAYGFVAAGAVPTGDEMRVALAADSRHALCERRLLAALRGDPDPETGKESPFESWGVPRNKPTLYSPRPPWWWGRKGHPGRLPKGMPWRWAET